jgi:hypothetical protein
MLRKLFNSKVFPYVRISYFIIHPAPALTKQGWSGKK